MKVKNAATTKAYGECRSGSSHSTVVGLGGDGNDGNEGEKNAATTKAYGECRSGSSHSTVVGLGGDRNAFNDLPESYNKEILPKRVIKKNEVYNKVAHVQAVYVPISKALDERDPSKLGKDFAPSTTHSVRLLSCGNWMDGVATGGCAPSILKAHVLTHADLKTGQVYEQVPVCAQLSGGSILVQLGGSTTTNSAIRGLVPPLHLFDTSTTTY
jgi:hypothetical protein